MAWNVAAVIIGLFVMVAGGVVVFYLRTIKSDVDKISGRIDGQDKKIDDNAKGVYRATGQIAQCKIDCQGKFAAKEEWLRSEAINSRKLDKISDSLATLATNVEIVNKMPEIAGAIAHSIAEQFSKRQERPVPK